MGSRRSMWIMTVVLGTLGYGSALAPAAMRPEDGPAARQELRLQCGSYDPLFEKPAVPQALRAAVPPRMSGRERESPAAAIVQLRGAAGADDARAITRAGGTVLAYVPDGALLVLLPPGGLGKLHASGRVRWSGPLEPVHRIEPQLLGSHPPIVLVTLLPGEDEEAFRETLGTRAREAAGGLAAGMRVDRLGRPSSTLGTFLRITADAGADAGIDDGTLAFLASAGAVWWIEAWHDPRPVNDNTIWVGQSHDIVARTDYAVSAPVWNHGILGTGQVAAVLDTGLDADACHFKLDGAGAAIAQPLVPPAVGTLDLSKKVIALYVIEPGADPYAGSGHGTGTMGILAGDDFATLSSPTAHGHDSGDGMAPNARLVAQVPVSLATSLEAVFLQAYGSGARVHSNSWISGGNFYSVVCRNADAFIWAHDDFVAVFGGGNSGGAPNNGTVASPSVAKNVVSVGGCSPGSGNDAEDLLNFSRGPTADGRIKPDIVAPTVVKTAGSDDTPGTNNCSFYYGFGGTSGATPALAGFAVLVRQYFTDGYYPTGAADPADAAVPSAALVKACLLNGATPLLGTDPATGLPVDSVPSFNQGWGRVLLDSVLYFPGDPHGTRIWDRANQAGLGTGDIDDLAVTAGSGWPLKVTLVWTDVPGAPAAAPALVHDLDLEVRSPSGVVYLGNVFQAGESAPGGAPDRVNNVEGVLVRVPEAGTYRLRVVGHDVPPGGSMPFADRQGYALVAVTGACGAALAAPAGLGALDLGATGIEISWSPVGGATAYDVFRADGDCSGAGARITFVGETTATSFRDTTVVGGFSYAYHVRATDGCTESPVSSCAAAASAGICAVPPAFAGLRSASVDGTTCGVRLDWDAAASSCPSGPAVSYNVYRSRTNGFVPSPADLVTAGVPGTNFVDPGAASGVTYWYVVRAEDGTAAGGGPANGGNEDGNAAGRNATPEGPASAPGVWTDDGGDTGSRFAAGPVWSVSATENHTAGGQWSYESGPPGVGYPPVTCASIVSPPLALDPAGSPVLSYWASYNLDSQWDGVVVEVSEDGGANWTDLPPDAGYPSDFGQSDNGQGRSVNACLHARTQGAFSGPAGNPGLSGFAWYTTDLSSRAGRTVQIRFRLSSDGATIYLLEGLFLDDVEVSGVLLPGACAPCATPGSVGNTLRAVKEIPGDVRIVWSDVAGAAGYHVAGSLDRARRTEDFSAESPGGAGGAVHAGALGLAESYYYGVKARGSCGNLGP